RLVAGRDGAGRGPLLLAGGARLVGLRLPCARARVAAGRGVRPGLLPQRVDRRRLRLRADHALRQPGRSLRVGEREPRPRARGALLPGLRPAGARRGGRRGDPLTYFLDAYRAHFGFVAEFRAPIATGFALSGLYAVLAHFAFCAAIQRARHTGLLLKMSE